MAELISLYEAAERGIERVRQPNWANPFDHLKIDIVDGKPGPWLHLFAPFNIECNGRDPVDFLWMFGPMNADPDAKCFEPYTGPMPDSDEYAANVSRFSRLSDVR